jgi:pimeloyl-ACP methyl ester carboxylesterase
MPRFTSYDDTELAYHLIGRGDPLICLPGGAGRASSYLGDLGGLSAHRQLVLLDNRGTGDSAIPADPATYRRDRLSHDVEALRKHLGLGRIDLLGHSAGAGIAMSYAGYHPHRLRKLVLLTPALRAVDLTPTVDDWKRHIESRGHEPWFPAAKTALDAMHAGETTPQTRTAAAPLFYGRWDETAQAHAEAEEHERSPAAMEGYWAQGAFMPGATRRVLMDLTIPVLVYAGGNDPVSPPHRCAELAELIPGAKFVTQPDAGQFPWLDDPRWLVKELTAFLGRPDPTPTPRAAMVEFGVSE